MFLCSFIDELCTKEENDKTGCNLSFGHEYIYDREKYPTTGHVHFQGFVSFETRTKASTLQRYLPGENIEKNRSRDCLRDHTILQKI